MPTGDLPADYKFVQLTATSFDKTCPLGAPSTSPTTASFLSPIPGEYLLHPSAPLTMTALAAQAAPLLSIHITTFPDRQFVGICFPHAVVDAKGEGAYVRALAAELLRAESSTYDVVKHDAEVYDVSALEEYSRFDAAVKRVTAETEGEEGADPASSCVEGGMGWGATPVTSWSMAKMVGWQGTEWLWHHAEEGGVFLGREVVKFAVDQAKAEVVAASGGKEWLSTEDVLWAWMLKAAYADEPFHEQVKDSTAICARNLLGLTAPIYPHNAVLIALSPDVPCPHTTPLSQLALFRRRRLHAVRTPAKAAAFVRWSDSFWPARLPLWHAPEHDSWLATSHVAAALGTAFDLGDGAGGDYVCTARPKGSQSAIVTSKGKDGYTLRGRMSRARWVSVRKEVARLQAAYDGEVVGGERGGEKGISAERLVMRAGLWVEV